MAEEATAIRSLAQLADHVHWVRGHEVPDRDPIGLS